MVVLPYWESQVTNYFRRGLENRFFGLSLEQPPPSFLCRVFSMSSNILRLLCLCSCKAAVTCRASGKSWMVSWPATNAKTFPIGKIALASFATTTTSMVACILRDPTSRQPPHQIVLRHLRLRLLFCLLRPSTMVRVSLYKKTFIACVLIGTCSFRLTKIETRPLFFQPWPPQLDTSSHLLNIWMIWSFSIVIPRFVLYGASLIYWRNLLLKNLFMATRFQTVYPMTLECFTMLCSDSVAMRDW